MTDDIVFRLDRASAKDLYQVLRLLGEHIAAGAPVPVPPAEAEERLSRVSGSWVTRSAGAAGWSSDNRRGVRGEPTTTDDNSRRRPSPCSAISRMRWAQSERSQGEPPGVQTGCPIWSVEESARFGIRPAETMTRGIAAPYHPLRVTSVGWYRIYSPQRAYPQGFNNPEDL